MVHLDVDYYAKTQNHGKTQKIAIYWKPRKY